MLKSTYVASIALGMILSVSCSNKSADSDKSTPRAAGRAAVLPDNSQLAVDLRPQLVDEWCWAASGQMIMEFLGVKVTQCDQANKELGLSVCCPQTTSDPVPGDCNKAGWPEFDKYGFTYNKTQDSPIDWDELRRQISVNKAPVAFSWGWTGGGGHMMVATGFQTLATPTGVQRFVTINDPWPPSQGSQRIISYNQYNSVPGDHVHWDDYYNIRK